MSDTNMVLSMDVLRALNPDATENTVAEFDTKGTLHLIERDEEGNDVSDFEVKNKNYVDCSDLPSLDKRLAMTRKKSRIANAKFYIALSVLSLGFAMAIATIIYFT